MRLPWDCAAQILAVSVSLLPWNYLVAEITSRQWFDFCYCHLPSLNLIDFL